MVLAVGLYCFTAFDDYMENILLDSHKHVQNGPRY